VYGSSGGFAGRCPRGGGAEWCCGSASKAVAQSAEQKYTMPVLVSQCVPAVAGFTFMPHTGTLTFAPPLQSTYHYLCPVPGHGQKGMTGRFTVSNTG
jgi:hypothetical protein